MIIKVCFIVNNINSGGSILRAIQIKNQLEIMDNRYNILIIDKCNISKLYNIKDAVFFWIYPAIHMHYKYIDKSNRHILDIIDNYIYKKNDILSSLKLCESIIVNSKYMLNYFRNNIKYMKPISIIYHHSDARLYKTITSTNNQLVFGYMGSVKSLLHSNNFLHYNILKNKYNIIFYDTECGKDVTNFVKENDYSFKIPGVFNPNNIPEHVNFNCDINIREYNTNISKFKTTAKIATAAALGHNIITTLDMAIVDVLPMNYPFILKNTDYNNVITMMDVIIKDFNSDKKLWNQGLNIMKKVKDELRIDNLYCTKRIMANYLRIINL